MLKRRDGGGCRQVYFDVEMDGKSAGRITFELRADVTPKTAGERQHRGRGRREGGLKMKKPSTAGGGPPLTHSHLTVVVVIGHVVVWQRTSGSCARARPASVSRAAPSTASSPSS